MDDRSPGYFAVIPASVRYDDSIPANAKLLYGEISALIGAEGYCYAQNAYFADLYKLSERTITGLISKLQERGHIRIHLERDKSGQILSRKLFLAESAPGGQPLEKIFYTPRKNFREGIENNFQYTDTSNTNIEKESKKEKEKNKKSQIGHDAKTDFDPLQIFTAWIVSTFDAEPADRKNRLYFAFAGFLANREAIKKPIKSKGAMTALCNRLRRLAANKADPLMEMIDALETATVNNWQSVYPAKDTSAPLQPQRGRVYECL